MINAKRSILMVMDYQPGILQRLPQADELVKNMAQTIAAAREKGMCIGYVRVAFTETDYDRVPATNIGFTAATADRRMTDGTPETAVHPELAPQSDDIEVRKVRIGAFSTTDLDAQLKARDIDTLVLAGISTSGVVLSTVRDAADKDYRLIVLKDLVADGDAEVHDVLVNKVFPRQAQVITAAELSALVEA